MHQELGFVPIVRGTLGRSSNLMVVPGRRRGTQMKALKTGQF